MTHPNQLPFDWSREDRRESAQARDRGIDRAARASGEWQVDAIAAIRLVAASRSVLTTDDVWRALGRDPGVEGRAMGAAMRAAAKLGLVERTDRTRKSERVACHRRDLRLWHSRIYSGGKTLVEVFRDYDGEPKL
jgi:hypothetical protein